MEDYQAICDSLCKTLQQTRQYDDLRELVHFYTGGDRLVCAIFKNGSKRKINVTMDSGIAMIKDILKNL